MFFIRNCPQCKEEIKYKHKKDKNQAEKNSKLCKVCSKLGNKSAEIKEVKYIINCSGCNKEHNFKSERWYKNFINKNCLCKDCYYKYRFDGEFERACPKCNNSIVYKDKATRDKMNRKNRLCVDCAAKGRMTNSVRDKISQSTKGQNNPMYGKSYYDIWVEKFGEEEANKKQKLRSENCSKASKGENNPMYGKPSPTGSGNGWKGWYKKVYFASLKELYYLKYLFDNNIEFENGEQRKYKIIYDFNEGKFNYFLDFYLPKTDEYIEIKPIHLVNSPRNSAKFKAAKEKLGDKFIVVTEKDLIEIDLKTMYELYLNKDIVFMEKYEIKFKNYCRKARLINE